MPPSVLRAAAVGVIHRQTGGRQSVVAREGAPILVLRENRSSLPSSSCFCIGRTVSDIRQQTEFLMIILHLVRSVDNYQACGSNGASSKVGASTFVHLSSVLSQSPNMAACSVISAPRTKCVTDHSEGSGSGAEVSIALISHLHTYQ